MNLRQIARGNFKSLTGRRWVQTAYGSSHFDRPGFYPGGASKLTVSRTRITMNQRFVIRGRYLSDGQGLSHAKLSFSRRGKILVAVLKEQSVAINYSVEFYPRGVPLRSRMKAYGVKISSRKNRIVFWSSNNGFTQIFSQR